ncbi:MAG: O-antigen polymerase [Mammaliicoccus vitulinus]
MKGIASLVVVFFYIYPIYLKGIPIPLDRVYQLFGLFVLVFNTKDITKILTSPHTSKYLRLSFVLLFLALLAQLKPLIQLDFYFLKRILNIFLEFFSAYFVFWFIRRYNNNIGIGTVLYYIVIAAIVQTFVSIVFFIKPGYYEIYYSYLNQDVENKDFEDMLRLLNVRFLGIGSSFFGGIIKYGFAFFSVLILPYVHHNFLTRNKLFYWISVLIVFSGGLLTSRSFIIAIALGFLMVSLLRSKNIIRFILTNIKIILISIPSLFIIYYLFSLIFDTYQFDKVFNYTFEIFVNYFDGDGLTSNSTTGLKKMYVLPSNTVTWLFGDGRMQSLSGGYYMGTDVGYLRLIYYFGFPATIYFIYLLFKYYKIQCKATNIRALNFFFLVIFFWIFILNFKGLAFHTYYYILFILFMVLSDNNKILENKK